MDGRKALEVADDLRTAPAVPRAVESHDDGAAPAWSDRLPVWAALAAGLVGPALAVVATALEPAVDPDDPVPFVAMAIGIGQLVAWVAAAWTALGRHPVALRWGVAAAALALTGAVACPTTGHHSAVATWWFAELAVCIGALVATVATLRWWVGRSPRTAGA